MYVISMAELRDLEQSRRTDTAQPIIMQALRGRAIGFLPDPLPTRANTTVVLYVRGTAIGDFVHAVITASRGEDLSRGDAKALTDFGQTQPPHPHAMEQLEHLATEQLKGVIGDLEKLRGRAQQYLKELTSYIQL
ncbi:MULTISPECIES: hypothetical protein [unclassified Streptomyces]|uniref:hypothetical protein n=1 Tax=unclassified Streptomyces TaxID=2593676 RepID=UPI003D8F03EB